MAQTLDAARSRSKTSVHGRRLGIDRDEFLVGVKDIVNVVSDATAATTGTNLVNHGFHTVSTTANNTWILDDPIAGCKVEITTITTSTSNHVIETDNATIVSTNGVAGSTITLVGVGAYVSLEGISTSKWAVRSLTSVSSSTTAAKATAVVSS